MIEENADSKSAIDHESEDRVEFEMQTLESLQIAKRRSRLRWIQGVVLAALLVMLPFIGNWIYIYFTAMPDKVRIALGPDSGRYQQIAKSLKSELESQLDIDVELVASGGSKQNLELLHGDQVDIALFQAGSDRETDMTRVAANQKHVAFVSNLYPEATLLIVQPGIAAEELMELPAERFGVSTPETADAAIGEQVLRHLGVRNPELAKTFQYRSLPAAFEDEQIDVAIVQTAVESPVVKQLLSEQSCRLVDLPNRAAFVAKHIAFSNHFIPRGIVVSGRQPIPNCDVKTVFVSAQLVVTSELHSELVREIARIVHEANFAKRNELQLLFEDGFEYSQAKAEFPMHPGASRYYDPSLRPFLNPEFVDSTESLRSFVVSVLIAGFLVVRWWFQSRSRKKEHRLDRFIQRLLEIERQQIDIDFQLDEQATDKLEKYLDEVTFLRQKALGEFTAHEMNDDPAVNCFINMSQGLTDKINAKLTRLRLRQLVAREVT